MGFVIEYSSGETRPLGGRHQLTAGKCPNAIILRSVATEKKSNWRSGAP